MKTIYIKICALVVAALVLGAGLWAIMQKKQPVESIACTAEALMCPDGSGVGRQGAQCSFSPCPNQDSFVGELNRDSVGYRLIIASPLEAGRLSTYVMPLDLGAVSVDEKLVGRVVVVTGKFTEGNRLAVEHIEVSDEVASGDGWQHAVVRVGETKLINRVKVTLHGVTQDSRCPMNVQCIRAGNITAKVTLVSDTDSETFDMASDAAPHPFDSFKVSIISVESLPTAGRAIDPALYRVVFKVESL